MPRIPLPLPVEDVSSFARSLGRQLASREDSAPGHQELLNMVCRACGFRNFQHFKAQARPAEAAPIQEQTPEPIPAAAEPESPEVSPKRLNKLVRFFDDARRLTRWPPKYTQQGTCLWVVWSRLPVGEVMSEPQINDHIDQMHLFGDAALIRRELFDRGLITRTPDGREYRRLEKKPTAEALALMERLGG